ncbi:MAG: hypothetical protein HYY86_00300 [Candidatus Harrisonbacteria bacterium]|nr:hypothetical protein [Candidatus Harrisonbacteria bacterium]
MGILIWVVSSVIGIFVAFVALVIVFHYVTMWYLMINDLPFLRQNKFPWWYLVLLALFAPLLHTFHFLRRPIRQLKRLIQCYKYKNLGEIVEIIEFEPENSDELRSRVLSLGLTSKEFKKFIEGMEEYSRHPNAEKILRVLEEEEAKKNLPSGSQ